MAQPQGTAGEHNPIQWDQNILAAHPTPELKIFPKPTFGTVCYRTCQTNNRDGQSGLGSASVVSVEEWQLERTFSCVFLMSAMVKSRHVLSHVAQPWHHVLPHPEQEGIGWDIDLLQHHPEKESWSHLHSQVLCTFHMLHKYTVLAILSRNSPGYLGNGSELWMPRTCQLLNGLGTTCTRTRLELKKPSPRTEE